ncbi:MAG: NUDIX domain-containing protein [Clostridia bacterium]|nr:NUDIX domain-containing protein [Clostridia bacterium]
MAATDCIEEYFALIEKKPRLFERSEVYPIVTDKAEIEKFEKESGKKIGVLYKSRFNTLVVDLIRGENGYFAYERIIPTASGRGVVCVPKVGGKFLLLRQYRHSVRDMQLCFPRGFGEDGIASEDNAKKELFEETGALAEKCTFLGSLTADSGLIGAECDVFLCIADSFDASSTEEGIKELLLLTREELEEKITSREITDGFTLSAYMLYKTM